MLVEDLMKLQPETLVLVRGLSAVFHRRRSVKVAFKKGNIARKSVEDDSLFFT